MENDIFDDFDILDEVYEPCLNCRNSYGLDVIDYPQIAGVLADGTIQDDSEGIRFRVECDCGVSGPYSDTIKGAAQAWNMMLEGTEAARAILAAQTV